MNKLFKTFSIMLVTIVLMLILSNACLASNPYNAALGNLNEQLKLENTNVKMEGLQTTAGKVVKAIRNIAAVVAVVVLSILGIKYMMGSTQERAEYKKSMIPLIVGIVVVVAAASIATAIFSIAS